MTPPTQPQGTRPRWTGASVALVVIDLLILIPSGLCSGLVLVSMIVSAVGFAGLGSPLFAANAFAGGLSVILIFGGAPMALGAVLIYSGLKSRRRD